VFIESPMLRSDDNIASPPKQAVAGPKSRIPVGRVFVTLILYSCASD